MALDIEAVAQLGANILCRRFCWDLRSEAWRFWTDDARSIADKLATLTGLNAGPEDSIGSIAKSFEEKLAFDPLVVQRLERELPELMLAPEFALVASEVAARLGKQKPSSWIARWFRKLKGAPVEDAAGIENALSQVKDLVAGDQTPADAAVVQAALFLNTRVAASVALAFGEAIPGLWMRMLELDAVLVSRKLRGVVPDSGNLDQAQLTGLAFSGGGIRSATLNLGILQALAEMKLLVNFDYLSTVSGGGYIGSWLHAWIHRAQSQERVRRFLSPARKDSPDPESATTFPIKWLRQYSNYLAPRLGALGADTLSILTVWIRNMLLNAIVIVLALGAALFVPRGMRILFDLVHSGKGGLIALLPLFVAIFTIQQNLRSFGPADASATWFGFLQKSIHFWVALPVFLSAMLVTALLSETSRVGGSLLQTAVFVGVWFFGLLCYVSFGGGYRKHFFDERPKPPRSPVAEVEFTVRTVIYNGICAFCGGVLLFVVEQLFEKYAGKDTLWPHLVWGTSAVAVVYAVVIILHLGLFGRSLPDDRREWWSRAGAVLTIWLVGWSALAGASLYGPWLVMKLVHLGSAWIASLGTGWLLTTVVGVLKARGNTTGPKASSSSSDWIVKIAPPVFVVGLLLFVSLGVQMATLAVAGMGFSDLADPQAQIDALSWVDPGFAWMAFVACLSAAYWLARRVDINEFSMHNFYENRLVRAYLGASNLDRKPNHFTGFDPGDDLELARLTPWKRYCGPYPIINTCLNIAGGDELAWQERKAESFVFTPLFSGFTATPTSECARGGSAKGSLGPYGYRPTARYAFSSGGIRVGRAIAISGAAASPNWGYHTSPAAAFLLTVFNVRLGCWIGNPRHRTRWLRSGPRSGLLYLLTELAGAANSKSRYVYLSDGGHFENLGIYELVHRRCRYIVACDGGQDADFTFEDLGNAIRKCRSDFGVEIKIDLTSLRPRQENGKTRSVAPCAVGSVEYPDAPRGVLVYLKASLTGNEPADVLEYAALHSEFPHQSTADQFFDESQFESYRRLGYHIGQTVFGEVARQHPELDVDRAGFFSAMRDRWLAPSPRTAESFTRHAEVLARVMRWLREDPDLGFLETQISPEWERLMQGAAGAPPPVGLGLPGKSSERKAGFHFCNALLQLMEDVYLDLNLEDDGDHPDNAGWINLFHHWAWSSMFRVTWMISASCYGARFRRYCEVRLGLDPGSVGRIQVIPASGPADARLNFRERQLLAAGRFDWTTQRLCLLEIVVTRPDPPKADLTELTVGIAVVSGASDPGRLAYLRIQDHLRSMGLARRMLDAMVIGGQCSIERKSDWHDLPDDFPELVKEEDQERVQRMLESAYIRKVGTGTLA